MNLYRVSAPEYDQDYCDQYDAVVVAAANPVGAIAVAQSEVGYDEAILASTELARSVTYLFGPTGWTWPVVELVGISCAGQGLVLASYRGS